jgi:SPP1 gp7 family putative phage head morphogenesis protein
VPKKKPPPPPDPDRFDQAVEAWRRKVPMPEKDWRQLTLEERQHAFTVSGVAQARLVDDVYEALGRAIEEGSTLEDFQADVGDALEEAWGGEDSPRLEMLFRTGIMQSYNEGRQAVFDHPEVKKARPFRRYDGVGDARACDICDPLDGTVLPADDPFWQSHQPPLHPSCRCIVTALDPDEADDEGIDDGAPDAEDPADGFGVPVDFEPDYESFSPAIAAALRDKLG